MAAYKKLSRQHRSGTGYSRLWLGEDHLLLVTSNSGYIEEYRRFFFPDIQALIIRRTHVFATVNWSLVPLAIGAVALGAIFPDGGPFFFIVASLLAFFAAVNAALGPTCSVHVQTAIATHPLEPLRRLRAARKVLNHLLPFIHAAQGELTPERLSEITAPTANAVPPRTF